MDYILTAITGAAGLIIGWFSSNFLGKPISKFFEMRTAIRAETLRFSNARAKWREINTEDQFEIIETRPPLTAQELSLLAEAQTNLRKFASDLRAFADTNGISCEILKIFGFNPLKGSSALFGLANTIDTSGKTKHFQKEQLNLALKFRD